MTAISIGPAAEHELDALAALMRETIAAIPYYNDEAKQSEFSKYDVAGLRALLAGDPQAILVARDGAALTGFCLSRYDDTTIWLIWFGTAAAVRGSGIGGALLRALEATLPSRGAHKIWCDSRTNNVESRATLERVGFERVATLRDHWHHQDYYLWEWFPTR